MRVALIRPGLGVLGHRRYRSLACLEPLSLAILAALTPPDVEVVAVDDRFEAIPYDRPFDLVALSVGTFQARRAYGIADRFRARGVPVVMGGFHPTFRPEEVAGHADAVARGEAEALWPTILGDARRGELKRCYEQEAPPPLGGVRPDRRVLAGKGYLPLAVVQFGRGCRHDCDFCSIKAFYGSGVRHRPVADVVDEIRAAGRRFVFFVDDNLVADRDRARELLEAVTPLGIRWTSQVSLDAADDPALLDLFAASGCQCVVVGLETLDPASMRQMAKGWQRPEEHVRRLAAFRDRGIMLYGTFVLGYDGDGPDSADRTLAFAMEQKLFMANFNHLQPYPGTRLYERLEREGRLLLPAWWLDPAYRFGDVVFAPRGMTADELTRGAQRARTAFHGFGAILRRLLDRRANLTSFTNAATFLVGNVASRQDILRKQGLTLGDGVDDEEAPACT